MKNNNDVVDNGTFLRIKSALDSKHNSPFYRENFIKKYSKIRNKLTCIVLFSPASNGSLYCANGDKRKFNNSNLAKKRLNKIKESLSIEKERYVFLESKVIEFRHYEEVFSSFTKGETHLIFRNISRTSGQLDSLYCFVRNSFAHGDFIVKDKMVFLWNIDKNTYKGFASVSFVNLKDFIKLYADENDFVLQLCNKSN